MTFFTRNSKYLNLTITVIVLSIFSSCVRIQDDSTFEEILDSPYFVSYVKDGIVTEKNHGLEYLAESSIETNSNCDWILTNCDNPIDTLYFATTIGNQNENFYVAITLFPYDNSLPTENISELATLLDFFNNPNQNTTYAFQDNDGIISGNIVIGSNNGYHTYYRNQPSTSSFSITKVNQDNILDQLVIGIEFAFECTVFDKQGQASKIESGTGYLPFGIQGNH